MVNISPLDLLRIVIVGFAVSVGFRWRFGGFLMRALLGIVLDGLADTVG